MDSDGVLNGTTSGTVADFGRRFGTANRERGGIATADDLPAVVKAMTLASAKPKWCEYGCSAAAMCYAEQPSGACNPVSGQLELVGIGALCKGGGERCRECFPDSPCTNHIPVEEDQEEEHSHDNEHDHGVEEDNNVEVDVGDEGGVTADLSTSSSDSAAATVWGIAFAALFTFAT